MLLVAGGALGEAHLLSVQGLRHNVLHRDKDAAKSHVESLGVVMEHRAKHREAVDQLKQATEKGWGEKWSR